MTPRDLITGSLRLIGVVASGETPPASELTDGMSALNDMLDSWSVEGLIVYKTTRESFALVANQAQYTMGTSGTPDFSSARPVDIEDAAIELTTSSPTVEVPMDILNDHQWAAEKIKGTTSTIPTKLHPQGTYPNETFDIWPVPQTNYNLILYTKKPLTTFTSLSTAISVPPGYQRAMRYNLAIELAPEYGKEPSQTVLDIADKSRRWVKRQNSKPRYLEMDAGAGGRGKRFNILSGE